MKDSELLELCNQRLSYNPDTGIFTRKIGKGNARKGRVAGTSTGVGYLVIGVNNKIYLAHRLAFLMHHEFLPKYIDHKDTIKSHNWIKNLRECTKSENAKNTNIRNDNSSGYRGVGWHKPSEKWRVQIKNNQIPYMLGYFNCKHEAARVYNTAARMHHGHEFCYTNIIKE